MIDTAARQDGGREEDARAEGARAMAAVAAGDRAALIGLMARHGRGLRAVAARFLGSEEEAEEVVQDTFVKAWRHAARYDPARAAVSTWLYRIAVNQCIDRRRRRALRQVVGLEDVAEEVADPAPSAEVTVAGRARLAAVRAAIARLPGRQRMALLLSAVAGLSTAEVAESLGTSAGSAEQLLVRARRALRTELGPQALEEDG